MLLPENTESVYFFQNLSILNKILFPEERDALWLCEKCKNFTNIKDEFVRDWTEKEIQENKVKLDNFSKGVTAEKTPEIKRRSGVN